MRPNSKFVIALLLTILAAGSPFVRAADTPSAGAAATAGGASAQSLEPRWFLEDRGSAIGDEGKRAGFGTKLLLYPYNRFCDFLDVFSLHIGFGMGAHLNFHATRAAQLGVGLSGVTWTGSDRRYIGMCQDTVSEFSIGPLSNLYHKRSGGIGVFPQFNTKTDTPFLYRKYRDYWGGGVDLTLVFINLGLEIHPVEMFEGLLGIFTVDLLRDDKPPRWTGNLDNYLSDRELESIKRVVIVPSRVVSEKTVRLAQDGGVGVYYKRLPLEAKFGKLGAWMGGGSDRRAAEELSSYVKKKNYDIHQELLDRAERALAVSQRWDVINTRETVKAFHEHSVLKSYKGQTIRRLPNYRGLAEWYGADAILDVRVWEWGIWREKGGQLGAMRLDVEYKLLDKTGQKVLFDKRVLAYQGDKRGRELIDFANKEGDALFAESKQACDMVQTKFADLFIEVKPE